MHSQTPVAQPMSMHSSYRVTISPASGALHSWVAPHQAATSNVSRCIRNIDAKVPRVDSFAVRLPGHTDAEPPRCTSTPSQAMWRRLPFMNHSDFSGSPSA